MPNTIPPPGTSSRVRQQATEPASSCAVPGCWSPVLFREPASSRRLADPDAAADSEPAGFPVA